jgi:hypothetical protein
VKDLVRKLGQLLESYGRQKAWKAWKDWKQENFTATFDVFQEPSEYAQLAKRDFYSPLNDGELYVGGITPTSSTENFTTF